MNTELFQGAPIELKDRVDAIILADTPTSLQVVPTGSKSYYLIIWS